MDFKHFNLQRPPMNTERFYKDFSSTLDNFVLNEDEDDAPSDDSVVIIRKPASPIENSLRKAPKTIQELKALINERLPIRTDIKLVSTQDQQELASVLMSELGAVWPEMRNQASDPFLTKEENTELERKVAVTVVNIIEKLYMEYIEKLQAANERKIFNAASNISRFKTQLSFDANKSLNILNIRRKLANVLRYPVEKDDNLSEDSYVIRIKEKLVEQKPKGSIVKKLHITRDIARKLYHESELEDLCKKMPVIDSLDAISLHDNPNFSLPKHHSDIEKNLISTTLQTKKYSEEAKEQTESSQSEEQTFKIHRSNSLPLVDTATLFLEELEIDKEELESKRKNSGIYVKFVEPVVDEVGDCTRKQSDICLREDLKNLMNKESSVKNVMNKDIDADVNDTMPPLLQAMPIYKRRIVSNDTEENSNLSKSSSLSKTATVKDDSLESLIIQQEEDRSEESLEAQPSVVTTKFSNKAFTRTSDVRVSNRQNASYVTLNRHKTIYNNFKAEIDDATIKELDRNLFAGEEIKEVYEEVIKTINKVHLEFDKDDFIIKCPQTTEQFDLFTSDLLKNPKANKTFNQNITGCSKPPWNSQGADEWRNSPKFGGLGRQEILNLKANAEKDFIMQENSYHKSSEDRKPTKSYAAWLAWWRSTINSEDYLKFVSVNDNDFLSKIFHLYDSGDDDDDDDSSQNLTIENPEESARKRLIEERLGELQAQKDEYQSGYWNANSVLLGGLGKSPIGEGDGEAAVSIASIGRNVSTHASSARLKPSISSMSRKVSSSLARKSMDDQISEYLHPPEITIQDRLETIWNRLRMPENLRLDMAIKYSLERKSEDLAQAMECWENATHKIIEREELMNILEKFERIASDPNRFFQKGLQGSSLNRLDESKSRQCIHKRLNQLDIAAKKAVLRVQNVLKDTVTYEGRPYLDKLLHDKTEMLYWLQQERRATNIEKAQVMEVNGKIAELPPISTLSLL